MNTPKTIKTQFDYRSYKKQVVTQDVLRLKKVYKPRWYENIFLFGCIAYLIRVNFTFEEIDRGTLRKNIAVSSVIWMGSTLFVITPVLMMFTPWIGFGMYRQAIKKTELQLKNNEDL